MVFCVFTGPAACVALADWYQNSSTSGGRFCAPFTGCVCRSDRLIDRICSGKTWDMYDFSWMAGHPALEPTMPYNRRKRALPPYTTVAINQRHCCVVGSSHSTMNCHARHCYIGLLSRQRRSKHLPVLSIVKRGLRLLVNSCLQVITRNFHI